jgi:hypothetical protein
MYYPTFEVEWGIVRVIENTIIFLYEKSWLQMTFPPDIPNYIITQ